VRSNNKALIAPLGSECRQHSLDLACVMHTKCYQLDFERRRSAFSGFEELDVSGCLGMHHPADAFDLGRDLLEQPQPFSSNRRLPIGESREVAVGARLVADKIGADRVADAYENNRYGSDFR
jgi:hypothetical protein